MFHNYITALKNNEITSRAYNKWTLKEDLQLIKEVDDKKTFKEIALIHKRTFGAIKSRVIASIIYFRYNQGDTDIESLSREYNIEKIAIEKYIEKMNIKNNEETCCTFTKWKPEEDIKLIQEIAEKKTYDYIALEHKRTLIAIKYRTISLIIYPEYKNGNTDIDRLSREYNIEKEMIENHIEKNNCNRDNENIELNAKYDTILLLLEYNIVSIEKKLDSVIKIIQK
jgi:hypothetical protein